MARCKCTGDICSCAIEGGPGILITGSGGINDPFIISAPLGAVFVFEDSDDVDFTQTGAGTPGDPIIVTASIKCFDCAAATAGNVGDVMTLDANGQYVPLPVSSAPGAINVGEGISGDGTVATPLRTTFPTYGALKAAAS